MTREQSLLIVERIINLFPGPTWEVAKLDAYATAIGGLDADVTMRAVERAVREIKFRPSIAELLEFVRIERAISGREEAVYITPEHTPLPMWVQRWQRARARGDMRFFPEQMTAADSLARVDPMNYKAYRPPASPVTDADDWVQQDEYMEA